MIMNEIQVTTERTDDLPLLGAMLQSMDIADILDEVLPRHGNWRRLSLGKVA